MWILIIYVDTNNKTEYFIQKGREFKKSRESRGVEKRGYLQSFKIVTVITIVIKGSQTSLHSQDILTFDRESREGKDDRES